MIESASRAYAGIGDYDEWPDGLARPSTTDSYVAVRDGLEYVVLRRQGRTIAVYDVASGAFKALDTWPKDIETS